MGAVYGMLGEGGLAEVRGIGATVLDNRLALHRLLRRPRADDLARPDDAALVL
jgi:hypothetical protein